MLLGRLAQQGSLSACGRFRATVLAAPAHSRQPARPAAAIVTHETVSSSQRRRGVVAKAHETTETEPLSSSASQGAHAAPETEAEPAAMQGQQGPWSDQERETLWDSVSRCLLKLGKAGARESHVRSLQHMLQAHTLVKVQLNADPAGAMQLAQQLALECQAKVIQVRGRTILLAQGDAPPGHVMAHAQEELAKIRGYNMKRKNRGLEQEDDALPDRRGAANRIPGSQQDRRLGPGASGSSRRFDGPSSRASQSAGRGAGRTKPQQPQGFGAPAGPGIQQLIAASTTKGDFSKETLQKEWLNLAAEISKQEEEEFGGWRPGSKAAPRPATLAGRRGASKAPWRQRAGS